jgi:hypothetical protein
VNRIRRALAALAISCLVATAGAQAPVPAATPAPTAVPAAPAPAAGPSTDTAAALQLLLGLKAANEETLKKQGATLQQLDDLEKAVDQLKIFSKRG